MIRCFTEFSADSLNIKKVFKKLLGTLLCLPLKKRNYFIARISNIIEKTFVQILFQLFVHVCYVWIIPQITFRLLQSCFSCKNDSFFQLRTWRTLFTSFTHARKNPLWHPLSGWCNFMEKNCPEVSSFLNVRSLLWKTFCLVRTIWGKVFKDGPSEICGRQPLKMVCLSVYSEMHFLMKNII